jgi:actin-like ATPase involved in cell morphogenesis
MGEAISKRTGVRVKIAPKPMDCVCAGLGRMLQSTHGDFSEFVRYKVK